MKKIVKDIQDSFNKISLYDYQNYEENKFFYPLDLTSTLNNEQYYYSPKDEQNLPMKFYKSVGIQYNPTRIAAYALANYNLYLKENNKDSLELFIRCANWFLNDKQGLYRYNFDWGELKSGWISCMAQGEAISVLVRAYFETNEIKYLEQAIKASKVFNIKIEDGGVLSLLNNELFFEEYPSKMPTHTLNGFLYGLVGLMELQKFYPQINEEIKVQKFIDTINNNINLWNTGNWSLYDLSVGKNNKRNYSTVQYHKIHITFLKYLLNEQYNDNLKKALDNWEKGYNNFFTRIYALYKKIDFRLSNPAQR